MDAYVGTQFAVFIAMLLGLVLFHHHKTWVVGAGFTVMSVVFVMHGGPAHWAYHFAEHHRSHLLYNLAGLLPAFALIAFYFEHSGASHGLARVLRHDWQLLCVIFLLSIFLDNIAAAMIGGTIVLARYGRPENAPFSLLVGAIAASNLGGAGSAVGDTTTVMLFIAGVSVLELTKAFAAAVPAQLLNVMWAIRHDAKPQPLVARPGNGPVATELEPAEEAVVEAAPALARHDAMEGLPEAEGLAEVAHDHKVHWRQMWPILGIPGLIAGNLYDQPALGVWIGLIAGLVLAMTSFRTKVFIEALPNTCFLLLLVGAAEMLPLEEVRPHIEVLPRGVIALMAGLLSPWFDNIPLTAVCLRIGGFDWGMLAYSVGNGGSAMWFGSSAGVALGLLFPQIYNTKKWAVPFAAQTIIFLTGFAVYVGFFYVLLPAVT